MEAYSMYHYWEKRLRQHFDLTGAGHAGLGPRYNAWLYKARLEALERGLISSGRTLKGARVLEAGCGTGFYTEYCLRQEVHTYVGVDITSISVETLRKRYLHLRFTQADITEEIAETERGDYDVVFDIPHQIGIQVTFFHSGCVATGPSGMIRLSMTWRNQGALS